MKELNIKPTPKKKMREWKKTPKTFTSLKEAEEFCAKKYNWKSNKEDDENRTSN